MASVNKVRQISAGLADRDPAFALLRAKIHNSPDATDAQRVREYAQRSAPRDLKAEYEALAAEIDAVYLATTLPATLRAALGRVRG